MSGILVKLTSAQADALLFACSNTLAEPANFERGSSHERTATPLRSAQRKIAGALLHSVILTAPSA